MNKQLYIQIAHIKKQIILKNSNFLKFPIHEFLHFRKPKAKIKNNFKVHLKIHSTSLSQSSNFPTSLPPEIQNKYQSSAIFRSLYFREISSLDAQKDDFYLRFQYGGGLGKLFCIFGLVEEIYKIYSARPQYISVEYQPLVYNIKKAAMIALKNSLIVLILALALVSKCQEPDATADIDVRRNYVIGLINQVRDQQGTGLGPLYMDAALNEQAQKHSEDMVARNFFDHTNPDGQLPQDRATAANFTYGVSENIAHGYSTLTKLHNALMNSPPHFSNTNKRYWTRAGVGIKAKTPYDIYMTVVFSSRDMDKYPVTPEEKQTILNDLTAGITANIPNIKTRQDLLSTHVEGWLAANSTAPTTVWTYLRSKNYPISVMNLGLAKTPFTPSLGKDVAKNFRAYSTAMNKFGAGYFIWPDGMATVAVVFAS